MLLFTPLRLLSILSLISYSIVAMALDSRPVQGHSIKKQVEESKTPLEDYQKRIARDTKFAEEYRRYQTEVYIGHNLYKGPVLIYHCQLRHFACVNNESLLNCERNPQMGCMILKRYENQKVCFKNQLDLMLKNKIDKFCKTN